MEVPFKLSEFTIKISVHTEHDQISWRKKKKKQRLVCTIIIIILNLTLHGNMLCYSCTRTYIVQWVHERTKRQDHGLKVHLQYMHNGMKDRLQCYYTAGSLRNWYFILVAAIVKCQRDSQYNTQFADLNQSVQEPNSSCNFFFKVLQLNLSKLTITQ